MKNTLLPTIVSNLKLSKWTRYPSTLSRALAFKRVYLTLFSLAMLIALPACYANTDIQARQKAYLAQAFKGANVQEYKIWLLGDKKATVAKILGHNYKQMRVGYWTTPGNFSPSARRVWFLQEIGKDKYIDVAITIETNAIQQLRILKFRESRGWEVKLPFFTKQFEQNTLTSDLKLSKKIDNISGATLSYRAVTNLAKMALYLNSQIKPK